MKTISCLLMALLLQWPTHAHATLVGVENLSTSEAVFGTHPIGDQPTGIGDQRTGTNHAGGFRTGLNGAEYALTAVTLDLGTTIVNGGGFTVSIHSNDPIDAVGVPGTELAVLSGSTAPVGPGYFTFLASSPLSLSASTTYWILASVPHDGSVNSLYGWSVANTIAEVGLDGWSIINQSKPRRYDDGVPFPVWGIGFNSDRFSVEVTAIPENGAALHGVVAIVVLVTIPAIAWWSRARGVREIAGHPN